MATYEGKMNVYFILEHVSRGLSCSATREEPEVIEVRGCVAAHPWKQTLRARLRLLPTVTRHAGDVSVTPMS